MKGKGGKMMGAPPGWKGPAAKGGPRQPAGKGGPRHAPAPRLTPEQLQERLHSIMQDATADAAAPVAHLGGEWGEAEIVKRITKYMYKAASDPELMTMPWDKMCSEFIGRMMAAYSHACQEQDWFFSIDLPPVFFAVIWEMMLASGQARVSTEAVYEAIVIEYEDKLDRILLDRAMWEASKGTFGDVVEEKVYGKVFRALSGSYWPALDSVLEERIVQEMHGYLSPEQELHHVEQFFRKWIDDSMCRCWGAVPDSENVLTAEVAEGLFKTLIAPFGTEDPFSCIPQDLTITIGRPPSDWPYIGEVLQELFARWGVASSGPAKKRRKQAAPEEDDDEAPPPRAAVRAPARAPPAARAPKARAGGKAQGKGPGKTRFRGFGATANEDEEFDPEAEVEEEAMEDAETAGHSKCTSEGDCIGTAEDGLVQHMLNGEAGDLYCQPCWDSFVRRNPQLEGVFLDA